MAVFNDAFNRLSILRLDGHGHTMNILNSNASLYLHALPAGGDFVDNYIWICHNDQQALVVDPSRSESVLAYLSAHRLQLQAILLTHHHHDHVQGVEPLLQALTNAGQLDTISVYGNARAILCARNIKNQAFEEENASKYLKNKEKNIMWNNVNHDDTFQCLGIDWRVLQAPGHTYDHVLFHGCGYQFKNDANTSKDVLFCGDTLFSAGCGRIFDGTMQDLYNSLKKIAYLPLETLLCPAHEYTLTNLKFALFLEPDKESLQLYVRSCQGWLDHHQATLPTTVARELEINPFLQCAVGKESQVVRKAVMGYLNDNATMSDELLYDLRNNQGNLSDSEVFAVLRLWRNQFRI